MPVMEYVDHVLICADCREEFLFSADEQAFFSDKGFTNSPRRCPNCRAKRKFPQRRATHRETRLVCAQCGQETTVPFKPTQGRPVLCHFCFKKSKE
jgi:CxxC-x17-CxxC domain-containing protein